MRERAEIAKDKIGVDDSFLVKGSKPHMIMLYEYTRQYWVARDEDGYWLVPARDGGWEERTPFVGRAGELREVQGPTGVDLGVDERLLYPSQRR